MAKSTKNKNKPVARTVRIKDISVKKNKSLADISLISKRKDTPLTWQTQLNW